ncbi:hydrophobic surface binding protein A-domain-containing protein [Xylariales sp. PMI_506]|nr:hydrophobic surface binding protein A-domain-containing protein [Xylariales sp. PMI_506]
MVNLRSLVFLSAAVAAAPARRDITGILSDLAAIDTATVTLTGEVTSWDGTLLSALNIQTESTAVTSAVTAATSEIETESVLNCADSYSVISYLNNTLLPDIGASLDSLTSRESQFASLGISSLVLSNLKTLSADNDALGTALLAITATGWQATLEGLQTQVAAAFTAAIADFS